MEKIEIVIGSWGSYNECNKRALGSKWLNLSDYENWKEIEEELKKEGFELDGIDEELFVQDIEGIYDRSTNWDYVNPQTLFEMLKRSGVLDDDYKFEVMQAFIEVRSFNEFEKLVNDNDDRWDDDIILYRGMGWDDYGREMFELNGNTIDYAIDYFFDFENYGKYMGDCVEQYRNGLIEIL